MVDKKDSELWAYTSRCYTQVKVIDDKKDSKSLVHGFKRYEHLMAIIDMNELKALIAMNNGGMCFTWTTLCPKLRTLDAMNYSGLWLT